MIRFRQVFLIAAIAAMVLAPNGRGQTSPRKALTARVLTTPTTPAAHSVALTWLQGTIPANSECPDGTANTAVTSNNVYRTSGASGTETLLVSLAVPSAAYTDASVVAGDTYHYTVTALNCPVDGGPQESAQSNEVAAMIPSTIIAPPNAPTNLTGTAK